MPNSSINIDQRQPLKWGRGTLVNSRSSKLWILNTRSESFKDKYIDCSLPYILLVMEKTQLMEKNQNGFKLGMPHAQTE